VARPAVLAPDVDKLRRELRRVKDVELEAELKALHLDIAREIVELAEPLVPVLTGALLDDVRASGNVTGALGRVGGKSVPYAPPIHWGWKARSIPATPFLQDAAAQIEESGSGIVDRYDAAVARMLERVITT
jgi:uncharacterized protein involved in cysteine biosynthesis